NERIPSVDRPTLAYGLRSVRIVKRQKRSLGKNIRRTETCRMLRIAFNFDWPAFMTFNQETETVSGRSHTRGEDNRRARQQLFGRPNVRNNFLRRSGGASCERGKSERCRHDRKEVTPAQFIFWLLEHLPHLWQIEQLVSFQGWSTLYSFTSCRPSSSCGIGGRQPIVKTSSRGRRYFSGARWQLIHHSM